MSPNGSAKSGIQSLAAREAYIIELNEEFTDEEKAQALEKTN